ncbi:hypothetical protein P7K49_015855 [Saguinus oedipus]|uniref:Basic proline-rich protein-like n=1 Tax=Saguinus oedipus TaxID=9490 RepID=A0ABQ9VB05_SAGOE|nr:hypothetical protein P7K49_015855 [Saguinus oedipus]
MRDPSLPPTTAAAEVRPVGSAPSSSGLGEAGAHSAAGRLSPGGGGVRAWGGRARSPRGAHWPAPPRPLLPLRPRWGRPGGGGGGGGGARFLRARPLWARSCEAEPGGRAGSPRAESASVQPPGRAARRRAAAPRAAPREQRRLPAARDAAMKPGPPHRAGAAHGAGAGAGAASGPGARGLLLPPLLLLLLAGHAAGVSDTRPDPCHGPPVAARDPRPGTTLPPPRAAHPRPRSPPPLAPPPSALLRSLTPRSSPLAGIREDRPPSPPVIFGVLISPSFWDPSPEGIPAGTRARVPLPHPPVAPGTASPRKERGPLRWPGRRGKGPAAGWGSPSRLGVSWGGSVPGSCLVGVPRPRPLSENRVGYPSEGEGVLLVLPRVAAARLGGGGGGGG